MSLVPLLAGILLYACGGEKKESTTKEKKEETAPAFTVTYSKEISGILNRANEATWPYTVDTTLLDTVNKYDSLGGKEVEWLYVNVNKNKLNESVGYDVEQFFLIDSIKHTGKYAEWADRLDIGQMKYAGAYLLHKIHMNDTCDIVTWAIIYESVQACPYASGSMVFATVFYNGEATGCTLIGENMGAGDPPVSMTRTIMSKMNQDGKTDLYVKEINSESDEEGNDTNEIMEEHVSLEIKNAGKIYFYIDPPALKEAPKGKKK